MIDPKRISSSLSRASREELIAIIQLLLPFAEQVIELRAEVEKLKNQNSRNSSLPPSRDKQKEKMRTRSLRKKSGRKKGGQLGHKGSTLKMSDQVDEVVDYKVDHCIYCHAHMDEQMGQLVERKQVWDIPPIELSITEHRRYKKCCARCGQWTSSEFESSLCKGAAVRYGERLKNQIVYLSTRQYLPYNRLVEMMEVLYGCRISEGTINNIIAKKAAQSMDTYDEIIDRVQKSKTVGVDESGCSVEGLKNWAWAWVTPLFSLIHISDNRGYKTTESLFPNGFLKSVLNSDCWRTHLKTPAKKHQICLAHLSRECQGLKEFHQSKWASKLDKILQEIMDVCSMKRIPSKTKKNIEQRLDRLLDCQLSRSHKNIRKLKDRLIRLRNCITVCLYDRSVPPDNNASERAIRMIKLKSKISGTFRSTSGAQRFAVLRTIVDSAIKQGIHPFHAIQSPKIVLNQAE